MASRNHSDTTIPRSLVGEQILYHGQTGENPPRFKEIHLRDIAPFYASAMQRATFATLVHGDQAGPMIQTIARTENPIEIRLNLGMNEELAEGFTPGPLPGQHAPKILTV